jgi:hypothetical protein
LNGVVTVLVARERLKVCPVGSMMRKMAEPRYPELHAALVDQVGVRFTRPLAGCNITEAELLPAPLPPELAGDDPQAPSSMTAAATAPSITGRPGRPGLSLIQFIGCPSRNSSRFTAWPGMTPNSDQSVLTPEPTP